MIIIRDVTKTEDGYEMKWQLTVEQTEYLLTFAINTLLAEGLVQVVDKVPEEVQETKEEIQRQLDLDYLENLDEDDLPQA